MDDLLDIPALMLAALAQALTIGTVATPLHIGACKQIHKGWTSSTVKRIESIRETLKLDTQGLANLLHIVVNNRNHQTTTPPELVWTGPEVGITRARDTAVVCRDLFSRAQHRVLIATYVVYQGQHIFEALAQRLRDAPHLEVHMVIHIHPDDTLKDKGLYKTAYRLARYQWPRGSTLPQVYYDPRNLDTSSPKRVSMHAKCIVIDDRWSLVSSANFTEAAQDRNIEAGALIDNAHFARTLRSQFEDLITHGILKPLKMPST